MTKFRIEIFSDTLCPWCYIGKKNLDVAIAKYQQQHPDAEFDLVWRPFLLHPKSRLSGINKRDYFTAKYGPQTQAFFNRVETTAKPVGIKFTWDGTSGSSWDSHKLVLLASDCGGGELAMRFLDVIFKGAFEDGKDISDRQFLAQGAMEAGVVESEDEAIACMDSEEMGRRVDVESASGRRREIEAVPSYLVQGRYYVGGMQKPEVFLDLFGGIGEKLKKSIQV